MRLHEEFGRAMRAGTTLGVSMLDVDHLRAVNDTHGHIVGERIRRLVEESAVMEADVAVRVTVSIGGVAYPDRAVEPEDGLVEFAEGALHRAKEIGRNRVEIAR